MSFLRLSGVGAVLLYASMPLAIYPVVALGTLGMKKCEGSARAVGGYSVRSYGRRCITTIPVDYGSTKLSQAVIDQRKLDNEFKASGINYASAKIRDKDGNIETIVRKNVSGAQHSEELIIEYIDETYPRKEILELFSERNPC